MNVFSLVYFVWILSEIILNRLLRAGKSDKASADKNTLLYLWLTIISSIAIGVFVSKTTRFPIIRAGWFEILGCILIIVGIIFRLIAVRQLGKFFTVDVTIRENHQLVQSRLYKFLRHPTYAGSLLSFLGMGLSLNNWLSFAIVFLPTLLAFVHRMNIEEKVLTEQFGKQYADYIARTKRLIPFLY